MKEVTIGEGSGSVRHSAYSDTSAAETTTVLLTEFHCPCMSCRVYD